MGRLAGGQVGKKVGGKGAGGQVGGNVLLYRETMPGSNSILHFQPMTLSVIKPCLMIKIMSIIFPLNNDKTTV